MYAFRNFKTGKNVFNLHDKIVAKTSFSYVVKVTDAESQEHTFFQGQSPDVFGVVKQTYPGSNVDRLVSFGDSNADIGNTAATIPVDTPNLGSPYNGVFCNGNVVTQNLAGPYGFGFDVDDLSRKCSKIGGYGYGYGGALVSATNGTIPSLTDQIGEYKIRGDSQQDNTLHTITCGAGDIIKAVNAATSGAANSEAVQVHSQASRIYKDYCYRKLMVQFRDEGINYSPTYMLEDGSLKGEANLGRLASRVCLRMVGPGQTRSPRSAVIPTESGNTAWMRSNVIPRLGSTSTILNTIRTGEECLLRTESPPTPNMHDRESNPWKQRRRVL